MIKLSWLIIILFLFIWILDDYLPFICISFRSDSLNDACCICFHLSLTQLTWIFNVHSFFVRTLLILRFPSPTGFLAAIAGCIWSLPVWIFSLRVLLLVSLISLFDFIGIEDIFVWMLNFLVKFLNHWFDFCLVTFL